MAHTRPTMEGSPSAGADQAFCRAHRCAHGVCWARKTDGNAAQVTANLPALGGPGLAAASGRDFVSIPLEAYRRLGTMHCACCHSATRRRICAFPRRRSYLCCRHWQKREACHVDATPECSQAAPTGRLVKFRQAVTIRRRVVGSIVGVLLQPPCRASAARGRAEGFRRAPPGPGQRALMRNRI